MKNEAVSAWLLLAAYAIIVVCMYNPVPKQSQAKVEEPKPVAFETRWEGWDEAEYRKNRTTGEEKLKEEYEGTEDVLK